MLRKKADQRPTFEELRCESVVDETLARLGHERRAAAVEKAGAAVNKSSATVAKAAAGGN